MRIQQQRILAGQCPLCGKEAAPYRLCYSHRQQQRITRLLKRGERHGVIKSERRIDGAYYSVGEKINDPEASRLWHRWGTEWNLPETDRRGRPRLRGVSVDVEATLVAVITRIGRPCSIEEITEAWGRLRDRRSSPLPSDLATIIAAKDKRERKLARRAEQNRKAG
jgi:hypothetical protein